MHVVTVNTNNGPVRINFSEYTPDMGEILEHEGTEDQSQPEAVEAGQFIVTDLMHNELVIRGWVPPSDAASIRNEGYRAGLAAAQAEPIMETGADPDAPNLFSVEGNQFNAPADPPAEPAKPDESDVRGDQRQETERPASGTPADPEAPAVAPAPSSVVPPSPAAVIKQGRKWFVSDATGNVITSEAFSADGYTTEKAAWDAIMNTGTPNA